MVVNIITIYDSCWMDRPTQFPLQIELIHCLIKATDRHSALPGTKYKRILRCRGIDGLGIDTRNRPGAIATTMRSLDGAIAVLSIDGIDDRRACRTIAGQNIDIRLQVKLIPACSFCIGDLLDLRQCATHLNP